MSDRPKNGMLIRMLDVEGLMNCQVGDVGRYIAPVIRDGEIVHQVNLVALNRVTLRREQFEVIDTRMALDIGDKVFYSTTESDYIARPFIVRARQGIKLYYVESGGIRMHAHVDKLIPAAMANRYSKNLLTKEEWL